MLFLLPSSVRERGYPFSATGGERGGWVPSFFSLRGEECGGGTLFHQRSELSLSSLGTLEKSCPRRPLSAALPCGCWLKKERGGPQPPLPPPSEKPPTALPRPDREKKKTAFHKTMRITGKKGTYSGEACARQKKEKEPCFTSWVRTASSRSDASRAEQQKKKKEKREGSCLLGNQEAGCHAGGRSALSWSEKREKPLRLLRQGDERTFCGRCKRKKKKEGELIFAGRSGKEGKLTNPLFVQFAACRQRKPSFLPAPGENNLVGARRVMRPRKKRRRITWDRPGKGTAGYWRAESFPWTEEEEKKKAPSFHGTPRGGVMYTALHGTMRPRKKRKKEGENALTPRPCRLKGKNKRCSRHGRERRGRYAALEIRLTGRGKGGGGGEKGVLIACFACYHLSKKERRERDAREEKQLSKYRDQNVHSPNPLAKGKRGKPLLTVRGVGGKKGKVGAT